MKQPGDAKQRGPAPHVEALRAAGGQQPARQHHRGCHHEFDSGNAHPAHMRCDAQRRSADEHRRDCKAQSGDPYRDTDGDDES